MDKSWSKSTAARPVEWWAVFTDMDGRPGWWGAFTAPGFRHCYGFARIGDHKQLAINPILRRTETLLVEGEAGELVEPAIAAGHTVLYAKILAPSVMDPSSFWHVPRRGPVLTCASILAAHMGVTGYIMTPRALYKALVSRYEAIEVNQLEECEPWVSLAVVAEAESTKTFRESRNSRPKTRLKKTSA